MCPRDRADRPAGRRSGRRTGRAGSCRSRAVALADDDRVTFGLTNAGLETNTGQILGHKRGGRLTLLVVRGVGRDRLDAQKFEQALETLVEPGVDFLQHGREGLRGGHVGTLALVLTDQVREGFNPEVITRLKEHAAANVHIMLVSGAYTSLLQSVTKELQFDTIIGTEIPMKEGKMDNRTPNM